MRMATAVPVPTKRIVVVYSHADIRRRIRSFRAHKPRDVAVIELGMRHPEGYQVPKFETRPVDDRSTSKKSGLEHFTIVGRENQRLIKIENQDISVSTGAFGGNKYLIVYVKEGAGCRGDSGGPVYRTGAEGKVLMGMTQSGVFRNSKYVVQGTRGHCSKLQFLAPMGDLLRAIRALPP